MTGNIALYQFSTFNWTSREKNQPRFSWHHLWRRHFYWDLLIIKLVGEKRSHALQIFAHVRRGEFFANWAQNEQTAGGQASSLPCGPGYGAAVELARFSSCLSVATFSGHRSSFQGHTIISIDTLEICNGIHFELNMEKQICRDVTIFFFYQELSDGVCESMREKKIEWKMNECPWQSNLTACINDFSTMDSVVCFTRITMRFHL